MLKHIGDLFKFVLMSVLYQLGLTYHNVHSVLEHDNLVPDPNSPRMKHIYSICVILNRFQYIYINVRGTAVKSLHLSSSIN